MLVVSFGPTFQLKNFIEAVRDTSDFVQLKFLKEGLQISSLAFSTLTCLVSVFIPRDSCLYYFWKGSPISIRVNVFRLKESLKVNKRKMKNVTSLRIISDSNIAVSFASALSGKKNLPDVIIPFYVVLDKLICPRSKFPTYLQNIIPDSNPVAMKSWCLARVKVPSLDIKRLAMILSVFGKSYVGVFIDQVKREHLPGKESGDLYTPLCLETFGDRTQAKLKVKTVEPISLTFQGKNHNCSPLQQASPELNNSDCIENGDGVLKDIGPKSLFNHRYSLRDLYAACRVCGMYNTEVIWDFGPEFSVISYVLPEGVRISYMLHHRPGQFRLQNLHYTVVVKQELPSISVPSKVACFEHELSFNPPPVIQPDFVSRHQLSRKDIKKIYNDVPPRLLWAQTLVNGFEFNRSILQTDLCGHMLATEKLLKYFNVPTCKSDRLVLKMDKHHPQLPLHLVTPKVFDLATEPLTQGYTELLTFSGVSVLPVGWYQGYLKVTRVCPKTEYLSKFGNNVSFLRYPFEFLVRGTVYVSTSESFLVQTTENHTKIIKGHKPNDPRSIMDLSGSALVECCG